mgnify:CR=1 FL=1
MIYRTVGQFKTSYRKDQALFPVRQDAILLMIVLAFTVNLSDHDAAQLRA